jgi:hypothetical protein
MRRHSTRLSQAHDEPDEGDDGLTRTADRDYPELGTILDDRPDPGSVITVIGARRTANAYGTDTDDRDGQFNGEPGDAGVYWSEPGQQQWTQEHEPQEPAPPPPWAMSPMMARLAELEEARGFFGSRHHATDINGTHVDDHGDAPEHGTVPRAGNPDSYDDRSTEGDGDPKWDDPVDARSKEDYNGATVGMYPEGISAGGGPGISVGPVTAHGRASQYGRDELEHHLQAAHGMSPEDMQHLRLSSWHTYGDELGNAHRRLGEGRAWNDWGGETVLAHHRLMSAGELNEHMREQHGKWTTGGFAPGELNSAHVLDHSRSAEYGPNGPYNHGPIREHEPPPYDDRDWGETEAPDEHAPDDDTAATYHSHGGPIDPVFGSARTARVPWTPKERGTLHTWQDIPPGPTWGDFVPSSQFPFLRPGESQHGPEDEELRAEGSWGPYEDRAYDPGGEDEHDGPPSLEGAAEYNPRDWTDVADQTDHSEDVGGWVHHTLSSLREAASDAEDRYWRAHLSEQHGWSPARFERARMRGENLSDLHAAGHEAGLADHQPHAISSEQRIRAQRDLEREETLGNMFGPDISSAPGKDAPEGYGLAHPARGGYAGGDPMGGIVRSRELPNPTSAGEWEERDPARFRRWMSSLTVHAHDDPDNSLDSETDRTGPDTGLPQASEWGGEDNTLDDGPDPGDGSGIDEHPEQWPAAGAAVNETSRAMTQGRYDGKTRRGGGDHLAAFVAAAGSPAFRFEFTASWQDVIAKARRIRSEGHVRITHASAGMVIGEVRGDHDTYESGIQRPVGRRQSIQHWACGCPWASFHQSEAALPRYAARARSGYAGRPCSHVMALQFEAQSRGMFGRQFGADESLPPWSPPTVVVKSMPPWEGEPHAGRWREEWRAPVASVRRTGTTDEARDWDWTPEDRDEWERAVTLTGAPCHRATASLLRSGTDPAEVDALRLLAGLGPVSADVARSGALLARHLTVAHGLPEAKAAERCRDVPGALGWHDLLHEARAAVAVPHRHDPPGEPGAGLLPVESRRVTADGANGPWGSDNTVSHPPQKPYGATSPPDKDMDPGSYGPLSAPDPENWGRIDSGDVFQMPIGNIAAVRPVPGDLHWPDQSQDEQGTFGYQDRASAAGPSTAMTPRDPNGIRMEEVLGRDGQPSPGTQWLADHFRDEHPHLTPDLSARLSDLNAMHHADHAANETEDDWDRSTYHDSEVGEQDQPWANSYRYIPHEGPIDPVFGSRAELRDEPEAALPSTTGDDLEATAAADGTIGGGDAGDGTAQEAPLDTAALGEFGASVQAEFARKFGGPTAMGDQSVAEGLSGGAQEPSMTGQQPGMGSMDEPLMPDDQSIQTIGTQQWSGGGADSDEGAVEPGQPQGGIDDIVASFQRSAAARAYVGGGGSGGAATAEPGDIAGAARAYLAKTAEVLPQAEADELIREGRGQRARNLDLLNLEGTHYEDEDGSAKTGVNTDDYEDDVIFA